MRCEHFELQLNAYIDDELTGTELTVVEAHLRSCASCRQVAQTLSTMHDLMRASAPPLRTEPAATPAADPVGPRPYAILATAAAVVFVLLFAGYDNWMRTAVRPGSPATSSQASSGAPPQAAMDCRIGAPGSSCEIEIPASFCSSARDCGLPF